MSVSPDRRIAALEQEKLALEERQGRLEEQIRGLRKGLAWYELDRRRLQRELTGVEEEARRWSAQYVEAEQRNHDLAIAVYRLHAVLGGDEELEAADAADTADTEGEPN
jgi:hypothetical protein